MAEIHGARTKLRVAAFSIGGFAAGGSVGNTVAAPNIKYSAQSGSASI